MRLRADFDRLGAGVRSGSGAGFGVRSGTGSRIGSTTIFLSGFPISITGSHHRKQLCARGRARPRQAGARAAD
jgi:hypothetical protein